MAGGSKWLFRGIPCPDRMYCGNGGACTYFPRLSVRACNCTDGFEGERCEFTSVSSTEVAQSRKDFLNNDDTLKVFLFLSNCFILITVIVILVVLCRIRRSSARFKKSRRRGGVEEPPQARAGPLRLSLIRRAIGWTFRGDLKKPDPEVILAPDTGHEDLGLVSMSKWTSVRERLVPSLSSAAGQ